MKKVGLFFLMILIGLGYYGVAVYYGFVKPPEKLMDQLKEVKYKIEHDSWVQSQDWLKSLLGLENLDLSALVTDKEIYYIWKDDQGQEHIVDKIEKIPESFRCSVTKVDTEKLNSNLKLLTTAEEGQLLNQVQGKPQPAQFKDAEHQILIYSYGEKTKIQDAIAANLNETKAYFQKFNMPYRILDVATHPEYAAELKIKLALDPNKQYDNINFPVIEIDGTIIERIVEESDSHGKATKTALNTAKINKIFGLRATFE